MRSDVTRAMTRLREWLLYPSVVMAASAAGWSLTSALVLGLRRDPIVHALVFMLALLFYNRDRLAGREGLDDLLNAPERAKWVTAHRVELRCLVQASALGSLLLAARRPEVLPPILGGLGFALLYTARLLPGKRSLKQLPAMKVPYVATLWTLLVVGAPLAAARGAFDRSAAVLAGAIFSLVAAQITVNDIRDIHGDRLVGTQSLAALFGESGARLAALVFAGCAAAAAVVLRSTGLLASSVYTAAYVLAYRPESDARFRWIIEGAGVACWLATVGCGPFTRALRLASLGLKSASRMRC